MLSLSEYEDIAVKIISKYKSKVGFIPLSDELIGYVIRYMAMADWKYEQSKLSHRDMDDDKKRAKWRQIRGVYGIKDYLKLEIRRRKTDCVDNYIIIDKDQEIIPVKNKKLKFLIKNAKLSPKEHVIIQELLSGNEIIQLVDYLGIKESGCKKLYESAIAKIRKIANRKE